MATLVACPSCKRHARRVEERCPFCGVPLSAELRSQRAPTPPPGLSRARLYAFQAALVTGVAAACGGTGSSDGGPPDAVADGTATDGAAQDGASVDVASADVANGNDGADDAGGDVVSDVQQDHIIPPPPYGCVFPEACGVRV